MRDSLSRRIEAALDGPEPHPATLTLQLLKDVGSEELRELAYAGLYARVRTAIRGRRNERALDEDISTTRIRYEGKHNWPSDDEMRALMKDRSWTAGAKNLGVDYRALQKHCRARGIRTWSDEFDEKWDVKRQSVLVDFVSQGAKAIEAIHGAAFEEGKTLGLAAANAQRVFVDGIWKFLGDCSSADLRWLAEDHKKRAAGALDQAGYYLALAKRVDKGGYDTVRDMCTATEQEEAA